MTDPFDTAKQKHADGQLDEAMQLYRKVIAADCKAFKAHNNLGNVLEDLGLLDEAVESYQQAAELTSEHDIIHYNLGRALQRQGRLNEAINSYVRALDIEPQSVATNYNLGCVLYEQSRFESAAAAFRRALEIDPSLSEVHSRLGSALFDLGRIEEAQEAYKQTLAINSDSAADHFNVGKIHDLQGDCESAAAAYQKSLSLDDTNGTVHARLAVLMHRFGKRAEMEETLERWLTALPDDPVALHSQAAMTGRKVSNSASPEYVRQVFDGFAGDYDATLQKLSYRGPQIVQAAIFEACGPASASLNILDAGCGTGLCGPLVKPYAQQLIGVDLSANMLAKAQRHKVYDELVEAELTEYLSEHPGQFELIFAADTLNYFGALKELFSAACEALRLSGVLIFTAEVLESASADTDGYKLNPHGRYTHSQEYLSETLAAAGFAVMSINTAVLRTESRQPVSAHVVQAQKENTQTTRGS